MGGNLLRLARAKKDWSQRQLAEAAGVPVSKVARIETAARQPSLTTLSQILAEADLELRIRAEDYDDVLDARYAAMTPAQRQAYDTATARTHELLAASRRQSSQEQET